jgi:hypothetical protein
MNLGHECTRTDTNKNQSLDDLVEKIIGAAYEVGNVLGA